MIVDQPRDIELGTIPEQKRDSSNPLRTNIGDAGLSTVGGGDPREAANNHDHGAVDAPASVAGEAGPVSVRERDYPSGEADVLRANLSAAVSGLSFSPCINCVRAHSVPRWRVGLFGRLFLPAPL